MGVPYLLKGVEVQKFLDVVNTNDRLVFKSAEFYIEDSIVDFYAEKFRCDVKWICSLFDIQKTSHIDHHTLYYSIDDKPDHFVMGCINIGQVKNICDLIYEFLKDIEVLNIQFPDSLIVLKWNK